MTTNVPEVLDKALIRPGRIDRQVFLGPLSKQSAKQIFLRMYTHDIEEAKQATALANKQMMNSNPGLITMVPPVDSPIQRRYPSTPGTPSTPLSSRSPRPVSSNSWYGNGIDDLDKMATAFMNKIPDKVLTPAEVQGFLLSHRDDVLGALTQCDSWVAEMLNAKQRKSNIINLDPAPNPHIEKEKKAQPSGSNSEPLPMQSRSNSIGGRIEDVLPLVGFTSLKAKTPNTSND